MTELKDKNEDPMAAYCCALLSDARNADIAAKPQAKEDGNEEMDRFYMKELPKMLGTNHPGESPKFVGGKDEYLKELSVSDAWDRTELAFVNATN